MEWVEVCGTKVPKHQLENARRELDELMDDQETQYRRIKQKIKDPESNLDVHTLLFWSPILRDNGDPKLAELALDRVDKQFQKNLSDDCSLSEMSHIAMMYAKELDMEEKTLEIMEDINAYNRFENKIALAELYLEALGDSMLASEYYRMAEEQIENLKQRCILAESVKRYFSKNWAEAIRSAHIKNELEYADFETLLSVIDVLEDFDIDLADEAKLRVLKLSENDRSKLDKLLTISWASDYENEIQKMLSENNY